MAGLLSIAAREAAESLKQLPDAKAVTLDEFPAGSFSVVAIRGDTIVASANVRIEPGSRSAVTLEIPD